MIRRQLPQPPLEYLRWVSDAGLHDFLLRKIGDADLRRKEVRDVLEEWVQAEALWMLAQWLREFRNASGNGISVVPPLIPPQKAQRWPPTPRLPRVVSAD